jgi:hypothetical protein
MKFRLQLGGLEESMATEVELEPTKEAISQYLAEKDINVRANDIKVKHYKYDERTKWDTHIVTCPQGVVGFTDGPIQEAPVANRCLAADENITDNDPDFKLDVNYIISNVDNVQAIERAKAYAEHIKKLAEHIKNLEDKINYLIDSKSIKKPIDTQREKAIEEILTVLRNNNLLPGPPVG